MTSDLFSHVPNDWRAGLASADSEFFEIDELLSQAELSGVCVVPNKELIFASLSVKPNQVSVVVIGQDPYPILGHATGMAFAVPKGTHPIPGSLRNILKEVESDTGQLAKSDCTLSSWVAQGVLLLNTSLTTELGARAAHSNWPWRSIVIKILELVVESNPEVVAVLWGNHAKQYAHLFDPSSIVESVHPSPLSANRGFLGSKPFSKVNDILSKQGRAEIVW